MLQIENVWREESSGDATEVKQAARTPDGKWAACLMPKTPNYRIVGVYEGQVSAYLKHDKDKTGLIGDCWFIDIVADNPFVALETEDSRGMVRFNIASQIISGGQGANEFKVRHPVFKRGAYDWRWLRLEELKSFLGIDSCQKLWEFYFPYWPYDEAPFGLGEDRRGRVILQVAVDEPVTNFMRNGHKDLQKNVDLERIWVPAGWAMNILRLHALGLRPE